MNLSFTLNNRPVALAVQPGDTLLKTLRGLGMFSVKHGCESGECGACTVLVDGRPVVSCVMLAAQAAGRHVTTLEALGEHPEQGWKPSQGLHPLQKAFAANGSVQCGYCTPGMILAAQALLAGNPRPSETEVRDALSGVLCRCTGYVKPVQAVLDAAAELRGERIIDLDHMPPLPPDLFSRRADDAVGGEETAGEALPMAPEPGGGVQTEVKPDVVRFVVKHPPTEHVGKPEIKVDALKLVLGRPAFVADEEKRGLLHGKLLLSPHAHARIKRIDASQARALPGVHAVLTHEDIPRIAHSSAGQSDPIPGPLDYFSLPRKVRFVGDRVAAVAAETPEIARQALDLIEVEYEPLPAILDPAESLGYDPLAVGPHETPPASPPVLIHDEAEYVNFADSDPSRNLAAEIRIDLGNVDDVWEAPGVRVFEDVYESPRVQQTPIEPYVCMTWWDEDDRLVIRTSTQVPFHVRRMMAPVLGLPIKRIRVVKPRIGGGFGNKQEVMIEDICAHLTIATGRPVLLEYTRAEQFLSSTSRHPMRLKMKTAVDASGRILANEMRVLSDTGAYGGHALTVTGNTGHKAMAIYNAANIRFYADVVYTNLPTSGAYRGYGVPQGFVAVENHMAWIAQEMGLDPIQFRLQNALKPGDEHPISKAWSEGREAHAELIHTCELEECARVGAEIMQWQRRQELKADPTLPGHLKRGLGVALVMQGTAIPRLDMGAASIKMNDDGSFNLLVGATDLGTGSDTVLTQMAADVLGCPISDFITYSSDTDFTPFDVGAYASSTTFISGAAVVQAAHKVAEQIREVAARMLSAADETVEPYNITLEDRRAWAPDGRSLTLAEIALNSLHQEDQHQIMAVGSYVSPDSPPPFAAQFAQVLVDTETGQVTVEKLAMVLDCGVIVNPATASGQVEGGMTQALGFAVCEEMTFAADGRLHETDFDSYHIFRADEMPELHVRFVETFEPTHPFGIKAVAEIPLDGVGPAVANAVYDAIGVRVKQLPLKPERVWRALNAR